MTSYNAGVWAAALTPFNDDLSVDLNGLSAHIRWLFEHGCDGAAVLGTTGEANSLTVEERKAIILSTEKTTFPPERIMVGVGCCALQDTVDLARCALDSGYCNLLMLPPFYYKGVPEDGLFRSYADVIEKLDDPRARIFVYHFPQMTGLDMSVDFLIRLKAAFPELIVGVKNSSGNWDDMKDACNRISDFGVFSGTEKYLLPLLREGGPGCISATANVLSGTLAAVMEGWRTPDAEKLQERATQLRLMLQNYATVASLKEIMAVASGRPGWRRLRPPLIPLADDRRQSLFDDLSKNDFDLTGLF